MIVKKCVTESLISLYNKNSLFHVHWEWSCDYINANHLTMSNVIGMLCIYIMHEKNVLEVCSISEGFFFVVFDYIYKNKLMGFSVYVHVIYWFTEIMYS